LVDRADDQTVASTRSALSDHGRFRLVTSVELDVSGVERARQLVVGQATAPSSGLQHLRNRLVVHGRVETHQRV